MIIRLARENSAKPVARCTPQKLYRTTFAEQMVTRDFDHRLLPMLQRVRRNGCDTCTTIQLVISNLLISWNESFRFSKTITGTGGSL